MNTAPMIQNLYTAIERFLLPVRDAQERYFRLFRDRVYPASFREEINEQCRIFFPFYAVPFSVVALPYAALDPLLLPHEPLVVALRYGMTLVVLLALLVRRLWHYDGRHRLIAAGMMYYLIIAAGIITGLAKAHPSYFGGYCYVIVLMGALPAPPTQLFVGLLLSLLAFAGLSIHFGVNFAEPAVRYGLQDLMSSIVVHICLSFGWALLRRNSYEQGWALQEQKRLLEHQAEELIALNTEKNEVLSIVAHDLKNPISAVRGLGELIKSGYTEGKQLEDVALQIMNTSDRMLDLVKNLLAENQLEEGKVQFLLIPLHLAALVKLSVSEYRQTAALKNITLHCTDETNNGRAIADEQALKQVLDNLLSNAVKYSPLGKNVYIRIKEESGSVKYETGRTKVSNSSSNHRNDEILHPPSSFLRLEVQDEGQGVSPEDMKKLFGKFARLTAQPTGGEHSTGLGLSIVKKMVEAMNGRVWCESVSGKGATFIVELPKA